MNFANAWTVYRTRFLVRACQLTEPLTFTDALGREHSGEPGDYLVESSEGCFRITARKIFEDVYVPFSPSPPQDAREKRANLEQALRILDQWTVRRSRCMEQPTPAAGLGPKAHSCVNGPAPALSG